MILGPKVSRKCISNTHCVPSIKIPKVPCEARSNHGSNLLAANSPSTILGISPKLHFLQAHTFHGHIKLVVRGRKATGRHPMPLYAHAYYSIPPSRDKVFTLPTFAVLQHLSAARGSTSPLPISKRSRQTPTARIITSTPLTSAIFLQHTTSRDTPSPSPPLCLYLKALNSSR